MCDGVVQGCALTIGPLGVSIIHKHRQEVLNNDRPSHIVFAKVMPMAGKDAKEYDCFGYITQNIKLVRHSLLTTLCVSTALII